MNDELLLNFIIFFKREIFDKRMTEFSNNTAQSQFQWYGSSMHAAEYQAVMRVCAHSLESDGRTGRSTQQSAIKKSHDLS